MNSPPACVAAGPLKKSAFKNDATHVRQKFIGTADGCLFLLATIAPQGFRGLNPYYRCDNHTWNVRYGRIIDAVREETGIERKQIHDAVECERWHGQAKRRHATARLRLGLKRSVRQNQRLPGL